MATIGQTLPQPETGWKRYDNTYSLIEYTGDFTHETVTGAYNNTTSFNPKGSTGGEINFFFEGDSIRILSPNHPTIRTPRASIFIDDVEYEIRCNYINDYAVLSFEKTNLAKALHKVVIKNFSLNSGTGSTYAPFGLDAIDINSDGQIRELQKKMIVRNHSTQKNYSLDDKTLIHLPDGANETILKYGIASAKTIALDAPFTSHLYPAAVVNKMSTVNIGKSNSISVKEIAESYSPIYQWYDIKMTSSNTPAPYAVSTSTMFSTTYGGWKAFDGDNATYWSTLANQHLDSWIMLDLGSEKPIDSVKLIPCIYVNETPITFKIETSKNGIDWTSVLNIYNFRNWTSGIPVPFSLTHSTGRYFRITHQESMALQNNNWYSAWGEINIGYKREVN